MTDPLFSADIVRNAETERRLDKLENEVAGLSVALFQLQDEVRKLKEQAEQHQ